MVAGPIWPTTWYLALCENQGISGETVQGTPAPFLIPGARQGISSQPHRGWAWPLMACLPKVPGGKVGEHLMQYSSLLLTESRQDRPEAPPRLPSQGLAHGPSLQGCWGRRWPIQLCPPASPSPSSGVGGCARNWTCLFLYHEKILRLQFGIRERGHP